MNIEGLVAGYTGPGGKTILPHRAVAKLDLRLVPDMTYDGALARSRRTSRSAASATSRSNPSGGYDPTDTAADAPLIQAQLAVLRRAGIEPAVMPRIAGSYPGYVFTGEPLRLPLATSASATAAARTRRTSTSSSSRRTRRSSDWDGAVASHAAYLFALAD